MTRVLTKRYAWLFGYPFAVSGMVLALSACNLQNPTSQTAGIGDFKKTKNEEKAAADGDRDDINFPRLTYYAAGIIGTRIGNKDVQQDIVTTVDYETLVINVVNNNSSNSSVRKRLAEKRGPNTFTRVDKADMSSLKKDKDRPAYGKAAPFVIFGKSYQKNGVTITFDDPIPVFITPKGACSYKTLDDDAITFKTRASVQGGDLNGVSFNIEVWIHKVGEPSDEGTSTASRDKKDGSACDDNRVVNIETNFIMKNKAGVDDPTGKLYALLPLSRSSVYEVNATKEVRDAAKAPVISRIWTSSYLEDGGKRRNADFLYKLCRVDNGSTSQSDTAKDDSSSGEDSGVTESGTDLSDVLSACRQTVPGEFKNRPQ